MYDSKGMSACSSTLEKFSATPSEILSQQRAYSSINLPTNEFQEIFDYVRNQEGYDPST